MQKKMQLLKRVVPLLILLVAGVANITGPLQPAKANPLNGETCQLIWAPGGNTPLDPSQVTDKGLRDTLGGYQVQCPSPHGTCQLVLSGGDTGLDLSNIPSTDYVPTQLQKDGYNISTPLKCNGTLSNGNTSGTTSTNDFDNSNGRPTCTLVWDSNAPTQLKFDQVQDQSLVTTLQGKTGLNNCTNNPAPKSCELNAGGYGDTLLNVDNLNTSSTSWIYAKLHDHYSLTCGAAIPDANKPASNATEEPWPMLSSSCTPQDRAPSEGDFYSIHVGNDPTCDSITWNFNQTGNKTCVFTTRWYGGHTWVMNVFTSDSNNRTAAYLISSEFTTPQLSNVSKITVGMAQNDTQFGSSGDLTNNQLNVGPIGAYGCK